MGRFGWTRIAMGLAALAVVAVALAADPPRVTLTLARDGRPAATIVIARQATKAAQFAAADLQWHLKQITGGDFRLARDDEPVAGLRILVGESQATDTFDFKPQEYLIRFTPEALILAGRDQPDSAEVKWSLTPTQAEWDTWPSIWDEQGTMYAVYDFLERHCNVRWLNPTETGMDCPAQPTLTVSGSEIRRSPFFRYRYASYPGAERYDQYTGLWAYGSDGYKTWEEAAYPNLRARFQGGAYTLAKRGWNMLFRLRHREGGEICLGNHSLYGYYRRFWEPEKGQEALFESKHADWFAMSSAGTPGYEGKPPQMCYTSRGLVEQVAKDAREFFDTGKTYPGAQAAGNFFCVEPMDNASFCKCPDCQKWLTDHDADSPFFSNGRHSDYFFQFVNEVAKEVRKTHPDKWIVCLAYMTHAEHPTQVKLEPNVAVQYCFACNRLNYDRPSYEHEWAQLQQWRAAEPDRPLYLWLYYTFPVEIANGGKTHCFPGYFAHAIGQQFDLFRWLNLRGMFHCGYGQDVEAYVTYRLMDDPSLRVDDLLADYFTRLYGPAAGPMRQFYELIERTYDNPANYPESIASGRIEGHHHQTIEMAWGYLGNEKRMQQLAGLVAQAVAAAQTPEQKHRVELFRLGTWEYMLQGRQQYLERARTRYGGRGPVLRVPFAAGDAGALMDTDLAHAEALSLTTWRSRLAEPTRRQLAARLLQDGRQLVLQLEEQADPQALKSPADITGGDHWEVLIAQERSGPLHRLLLSASGSALWDGQRTSQRVTVAAGAGGYALRLSLPITVTPGMHLFLNLVRRSPDSDDEPMLSPSFGDFEDTAALREFVLDPASTVPEPLPAADFQRLRTKGLVAHWACNEGQGATVASAVGQLPGTLTNNAQWVTDEGRPVVSLVDSRRQCLEFGNPPELNLTGPLSLAMWIRYDRTDMMYPGLLGKGYEATGTYGMHIRPGNTPWFELDAPDGTRNVYNPTDLTVPDGQWCHIVATYDGAMMRVYINGREAGPGKPVVTTIRTMSEPLRFGWLGSWGHFNGCVRDLAIYNRALSPAEVFSHYRSGK